ncbi:hypothetical protein A9Q99_10600 [Gammaproteobacteria bacterium 45_16_T64]|nr:hypothetical protein A9Q99_10600 [Gammaproteobacteria bacterium 45_16_T64]
MHSFCKYHPLEPAVWHHERVDEYYCEKCVDSEERSGGMGAATSFLSGEELRFLGGANNAAPFWDILPEIFTYPLHKNGGIFLAPVFLIGALLMQVGGLIPLVTAVVIFAVMTKYGFLIIAASASGSDAPPDGFNAMFGGFDLLGKQLLIQLVFIGFVYGVHMADSFVLDFFAVALVVAVLPVSVICFVMEEDVASAFSPRELFDLISRIGWAYFLLYGFLLLMSGVCFGVAGLFYQEVSSANLLVIVLGVTLYVLTVAYRLIGYVIFQYQAVLGFISEDQKNKERRRKKINPAEAKIEVLLKEGRFDTALKLLSKEVKSRPKSMQLHENLSKLLWAMGEVTRYQEHGHAFMKTVHGFGDDSRLYYLYCEYHDKDSSFLPEAPEVRHRLAEQFYLRNKHKEALGLLVNLHKDAPNYLDVPHAYLLMAKVLLEGQSNPDKALQYLGFIKKNYPKYPGLEEVGELMLVCRAAKIPKES